MMRKVILVAVMITLFTASFAMAGEKLSKDKVCALLGDCGDDMVAAAQEMAVQCQSMMEKAKALMEKGKMIRGQGIIWQDKEMEDSGQALYNTGKEMYDNAKSMNDVCALVIAEGEKAKEKAKTIRKSSDPVEKVPAGDKIPY